MSSRRSCAHGASAFAVRRLGSAFDVLTYAELERAWKALRGSGAGIREAACVGVPRTLLVADIPADRGSPAGQHAIAIAAGMHGDEPAGPWALLSLVRDGLLDRSFAYRLWLCANPSGYAAGTRANAEGLDINRSFGGGGSTPEARAILTANRDRQFALSLDLHEDPEAGGFYCYELSDSGDASPIGPECVRAVEEAGFPIEEFGPGFDLGYPPGLELFVHIERGRVVTETDAEFRAFGKSLPYNPGMLRRRATHRTLTFETPRLLPWRSRLAMHRLAVVTAIERLRAALAAERGVGH